MAKTKSTDVATTSVKVDPRKAMKLVRSEVKKAVKQNKRVDEMGYTGNDIPRSQIALQDLLDRESTRHAKAREHILFLKEGIEAMGAMIQFLTESTLNQASSHQQTINQITSQNDLLMKEMDLMNQEIHRLSQLNRELDHENLIVNSKLASAMHTVKIMAEGVHFD